MWATTVWTLFSAALACLLARLSVSEPQAKEYLLWAAIVLSAMSALSFGVPLLHKLFSYLFWKSPLQLMFDHKNHAERYWKLGQVKSSDGDQLYHVGTEYRVTIYNKSRKTVKNVRVSEEGLGVMPRDPTDLRFLREDSSSLDIAPKHTELVRICWIFPPRPGDLTGHTATLLTDQSGLLFVVMMFARWKPFLIISQIRSLPLF